MIYTYRPFWSTIIIDHYREFFLGFCKMIYTYRPFWASSSIPSQNTELTTTAAITCAMMAYFAPDYNTSDLVNFSMIFSRKVPLCLYTLVCLPLNPYV
jgi:hypothetical protein